nr:MULTISPECIES: gamma-glutamyltransferase [Chelativorans]
MAPRRDQIWRDVIIPAIDWARSGWTVRPHVAAWWSDDGSMGRVSHHARLRHTPAAQELYCREDGSPKKVGDSVRNPDLAATLEEISGNGADAFYKRDIAAKIDADMKANGGLLSRDDLVAYAPDINTPVWGEYRGHRISTNVPPGGGAMLVQMLNILENFDLRALGHNSTDYIRVVCEAMKIATTDASSAIRNSSTSIPGRRRCS